MTYQPIPKFAIAPVYQALGGQCGNHRTGKQKVLCILHPDSRPSAQLDFSTNKFVCYACDFGGDALDLIMRVEGVRLQTAVERATDIVGGTPAEIPGARPRDTPGLFSKSRARGGGS